MNLSILDKITSILKYIFSSFLGIEMLIFSLLLLTILIYNIKTKRKFVEIIVIGLYVGILIGLICAYPTYTKSCIDTLIKSIMSYIYFPSTVAYFFIMLFITTFIFITYFSKKISDFKRIINYIFFTSIYFMFLSFVAIATYNGINLSDTVLLYRYDVILSIVQMSNLLLLIWILFTIFYYLYNYFKKKYDKE